MDDPRLGGGEDPIQLRAVAVLGLPEEPVGGANPFGQDQNGTSQGNSLGNAAARNGSQTTRGQGTGTPNGNPAAGTNGHSATGDSSQEANQDDLLGRRHGTGATTPDPSKPAPSPTRSPPAERQRI